LNKVLITLVHIVDISLNRGYKGARKVFV